MAAHGYESTAVAFPTCGDNTENTKQWDEVTAIQEAISSQLDGKNLDVVLVLHSYGGWPGSRAVKGLDKETRLKNGTSTGIIEVVFLAAFILPDNAPMAQFSYLPPWLTIENGRRIPNESSIPLLFSDMEAAAQKHWLSKFEWHRNDFTAETIPDAPWHLAVPKTYIITTHDKTATVEFQFQMVKGVIDNTWSIKSIKAGHEPFLSQPANLAKVLLQSTF
ncbi:hypothetical protein MMC28_010799 [Mycoblastus sanguinarius]|nr:hypothetical protein [Mycoblastus sanguinarius]